MSSTVLNDVICYITFKLDIVLQTFFVGMLLVPSLIVYYRINGPRNVGLVIIALILEKKNSDINCSGIRLLGSRTSQIDFVEISGSQTGARNAF